VAPKLDISPPHGCAPTNNALMSSGLKSRFPLNLADQSNSVQSFEKFRKMKKIFFKTNFSIAIIAVSTALGVLLFSIFVINSRGTIWSARSPSPDISTKKYAEPAMHTPEPIRPLSISPIRHNLSDPSTSLKAQLPVLRAAADRGDQHATCLLASMLDLCGRKIDSSALHNYPDSYLLAMDKTQSENWARATKLYEDVVSSVCAGLDSADFVDADERLLRAALTGNARAMAKFALLPFRMDESHSLSKSELEQAYKENAESMLNKAAEAGDLDAIAAVALSYSSGYIQSAMGNLPVRNDAVKTLAAFRTLIWIRDNSKKGELPPKYTADGGLEVSTDAMTDMARRLSPMELMQAERLASAYYEAYRDERAENAGLHTLLKDMPEYACAKEGKFKLGPTSPRF
jgi:hypothetical protein